MLSHLLKKSSVGWIVFSLKKQYFHISLQFSRSAILLIYINSFKNDPSISHSIWWDRSPFNNLNIFIYFFQSTSPMSLLLIVFIISNCSQWWKFRNELDFNLCDSWAGTTQASNSFIIDQKHMQYYFYKHTKTVIFWCQTI